MSEEMIPVRTAIPAYAGHDGAPARRLADQQVRAWAGERLAALRVRLVPDASPAALDDLILHCQFGNQRAIKALEDGASGQRASADAVEAADDAFIAAVSGSESVDAAGLPAFIAAATDAFARRTETIVGLKG